MDGTERAVPRSRSWTVSQWFEMLTDAGFAIERILEPYEDGAGTEHMKDSQTAQGARRPVHV